MHDFVVNSLCPSEDAALIQGLRLGTPQAFETLLELYERPVYRFVYRLLRDPGEAPTSRKTFLSRCFGKSANFAVTAVSKLGSIALLFARLRTSGAGLYGIAAAKFPPRRRPRARSLCADWLVDHRGTPFDFVMRKELGMTITEALQELDERLRVAVVLRDVEGLRYSEIADTLQISLGTVKSRILRGREALKSKLQRRLGSDLPGGYVVQAE